ncbi:hypothetical protein ACLOJK_030046 [Asimina triloba]
MLKQVLGLNLRRTLAVASAKTIHSSFPTASELPNCRTLISPLETDTSDAPELFVERHRSGQLLTPRHFSTFLSACAKSASLSAGEQIQSAVLKLGLCSNVFIGSALVSFYCKFGKMSQAYALFDGMPERNVVTWNSIISGYSQARFPSKSLEIFVLMLGQGISPTPYTFSSVLGACSRLEIRNPGIQIHSLVLKLGFLLNIVVGTSLLDMYSKCSTLDDSKRVFDEMPDRNVVSWTAMVTGYARHQKPIHAMVLVREMHRLGVKLNKLTYNSLLSAFSSSKDLDCGKQVHGQVIRVGLESDIYVAVTLVSMYSKCGSADSFSKIWPTIFAEDQVSCNSVIAGFSHLGNGQVVLKHFVKMKQQCIEMDYFTFASVLRATGILLALEEGKQAHALILKSGYDSNVSVQNGLVSMYARCGMIDDSKQIFSLMSEPDLVSWNSLLAGCAQHGYGREVVEIFEEMRSSGIRPDHTTLLSVLSACSHVGLLEKGLEYFDLMNHGDSEEAPRVEHYACIVDLLGRAGQLDEAESFIETMPIKPEASVYRALLSACRVHGNMDIATRAAKCLLELCPTDSSTYVLLSNVFAAGQCWDGAAGMRKLMRERGVRKNPGLSWIEVNDTDLMPVVTSSTG